MRRGNSKVRIGLIDVDSHNFPNFALMKISAYHKALGDDVSMYVHLFEYDKIYMSKVFTFTKDIKNVRCKEIIRGGTGYNLETKLPDEIDNIYPDYSLYNITDTAYGYLTRGCPRECDFCIVAKKEGSKSIQQYKLSQFYNGQKNIKLLDPNITAAPNCIELFNELAETGASVDFTQGVDLRLLTEKKVEAIKKIKLKMIHFAWDKFEDEKIICEKLKMFMDITEYNRSKIAVYVLTNFNTTFEQDLYRIYKLRDMNVMPYVMIYERDSADRKYIDLQVYANSMFYIRVARDFEDFLKWKNDKNYKKAGKLF
jgi:hypothetical protein